MPKLVDMELTDDEKHDTCAPVECSKPDYPWGLRVCLTTDDLVKLGLTAADFNVGDAIDMRNFGVVTSVSCDQTDSGERSRVEIQIQKMMLENEMGEPEMKAPEREEKPRRRSPLYGRA